MYYTLFMLSYFFQISVLFLMCLGKIPSRYCPQLLFSHCNNVIFLGFVNHLLSDRTRRFERHTCFRLQAREALNLIDSLDKYTLSVTGHHSSLNLLSFKPENRSCSKEGTGKWLLKIRNYLDDLKIKRGTVLYS